MLDSVSGITTIYIYLLWTSHPRIISSHNPPLFAYPDNIRDSVSLPGITGTIFLFTDISSMEALEIYDTSPT